MKTNKQGKNTVCKNCGKNSFETGGWLERINNKGVKGKWECRPSCKAKLFEDDRLISAITGIFYGEPKRPTI